MNRDVLRTISVAVSSVAVTMFEVDVQRMVRSATDARNWDISVVCESHSNQHVNQINVPSGSSDEEDSFQVQSISRIDTSELNTVKSDNCKDFNKWLLDVIVKGHTIEARVDTGAEVSTISKKVFLEIGCNKVTKTNARLVGYGSREIPVIGRAKLSVVVPNGKSELVTFYVTDSDNHTLLGMPAIRTLELIPQLGEVYQVSEDLDEAKALIRKYSEVFEGLGKFGDPVELVLKDTAEPRAVPTRLIPQNMRGKLKAELSRLREAGVIVRDTDPGQWISPLVLVNKPNGDLRLCLDPQYLNTQLVRAQCVIQTTTEIFSRISGSEYYTTVDAKQGFHQIRLDERSSQLTSFITPYGKFRYVRLPMGICNAPEIFHQRMSDAMSDIPGVEVYIDDIMVHAPTLEVHNRRLELVLKRCKEVGRSHTKSR